VRGKEGSIPVCEEGKPTVSRLYIHQRKVLSVFSTAWELKCSLSLSIAHGLITTPRAHCAPVNQNVLQ